MRQASVALRHVVLVCVTGLDLAWNACRMDEQAPDSDPQPPHRPDATRAAQHPLYPGPVQDRPLELTGLLPQAPPFLPLPCGGALLPVHPLCQSGRGCHGGVEDVLSRLVSRPQVATRRRAGQELVEIADDVELRLAQARDQGLRLLPGPSLPVG